MIIIATEIESSLESRPLTYLNEENVHDLLTPNHLWTCHQPRSNY